MFRHLLFCCLMTAALASKAGIIVEYQVIIDDPVDKSLLQDFPQTVLIGIADSQHVILRGVWQYHVPAYSYFDLSKGFEYHCNETTKRATRMAFTPPPALELIEKPLVTIGGVPCRKATYLWGRDTFEAYYTDVFGINFCPWVQVPGFAMQFSRVLNGAKVTYKAIKFSLSNSPEQMANISGYTIADEPRRLERRVKPAITGMPAPDFTVTTLSGEALHSAEFAGKVLIINFWFIACMPCRQEIPDLNRMVKKYSDNPDVAFLAITFDKKEEVERFLQKEKFLYQMGTEAQDAIIEFQVRAFPTHVVIDRQGILRDVITGPDLVLLHQSIKRALAKD